MEHEHDLSVRLQELYSEYEHQLEVWVPLIIFLMSLFSTPILASPWVEFE